MHQFELILQNKKRRSYDRIALLFFIISTIGMAIALLYFDPKRIVHAGKYYWIYIPVILHLAPFNLLFRKKTDTSLKNLLISVCLIVVLWGLIGYWWVALAILVFVLLYWTSQQELRIIVSERGLKYAFFPSRLLKWSDLNNLILKDGLLTIDQRDNRLIQNLIDTTKTSISEKEFNDFCKQQLTANS